MDDQFKNKISTMKRPNKEDLKPGNTRDAIDYVV